VHPSVQAAAAVLQMWLCQPGQTSVAGNENCTFNTGRTHSAATSREMPTSAVDKILHCLSSGQVSQSITIHWHQPSAILTHTG